MVKPILRLIISVMGIVVLGWLVQAVTAQEVPLPQRPCLSAPPMQLVVGQSAIIQQNLGEQVNVRNEPSTYGSIVGQLDPRTIVQVLEGPFCGKRNNLFTWWKIRAESGLEGWIAEGDSQRSQAQYFIAPLDKSDIDPEGVNCRAAPESILAIGAYAQVNEQAGADLVLRATPSGQTISYVLFGQVMKVVGGPKCGAYDRTFTWWEVITSEGLQGWVAEGDVTQNPPLYFVRLITELEASALGFREAVDPGCPNSPPSILQIGDRIEVQASGGFELNLRDKAAGQTIGSLNEGDQGIIQAGPECANFYAWWQIRTDNGQTGWVAEGDDSQVPAIYFIQLVTEFQSGDPNAVVSSEASPNLTPTVFYNLTADQGTPLPTTPIASAPLVVPTAEVASAPTSAQSAPLIPPTAVPANPLVPTGTPTPLPAPPVESATGSNNGQTAILPTVTPQIGGTPSPCQASLPLRLSAGKQAITLTRLPLRPDSSITSAAAVELAAGTTILILNGPTCGDGNALYTWWQVQTGTGLFGWVQESDAAQSPPIYYIEPVNP